MGQRLFRIFCPPLPKGNRLVRPSRITCVATILVLAATTDAQGNTVNSPASTFLLHRKVPSSSGHRVLALITRFVDSATMRITGRPAHEWTGTELRVRLASKITSRTDGHELNQQWALHLGLSGMSDRVEMKTTDPVSERALIVTASRPRRERTGEQRDTFRGDFCVTYQRPRYASDPKGFDRAPLNASQVKAGKGTFHPVNQIQFDAYARVEHELEAPLRPSLCRLSFPSDGSAERREKLDLESFAASLGSDANWPAPEYGEDDAIALKRLLDPSHHKSTGYGPLDHMLSLAHLL